MRTVPNSDLAVVAGNKAFWTTADQRRRGFHHLHNISRYSMAFRSAAVMQLQKCMEPRIANLDSVRLYTSLPWFSAMVILRGPDILFERYADEFSASSPHTIQSITKTLVNLMMGKLVEDGTIDLSRQVRHYIPHVGTGYAEATLQQVMNMDVANDYSQDFADPDATYYRFEEALGWRLPRSGEPHQTQRSFIAGIKSENNVNPTGHAQYKDTNTELLGWIVETATGQPLRRFLADITDAAGLENALHITTDREGIPTLSGGGCMTARDLARYFSLFVRGGIGVEGQRVGSESFIAKTMCSGVPRQSPFSSMNYSNHVMVRGRTLGHGGWGGQYALANMDTGIVGVFLSVVENEHAITDDYKVPLIQMLESISMMNY
jgi:CubicO group peptidase (beta-lactamase class C family)